MCVVKSTFKKQMAFIAQNYNPVSLSDISIALKEDQPLPDRAIAVTFDDGWIDNYTNAFPILKRYDIPATIFLPTKLIISNQLPIFIQVSLLLVEDDIWPDKAIAAFKKVVLENNLDRNNPNLEEHKLDATASDAYSFMVTLMNLNISQIEMVADEIKKTGGIDNDEWNRQRWFMNWDEIREMTQHQIDFGSHGQSHDLMINISLEQVKQELVESKKTIEFELSKPATLFSYPNGDYNAKIKELVQKTGYDCAVTVTGCDVNKFLPDRYALRRINISEGATLGPAGRFSKSMLACRIEGIY
ncbi:MAG: polysaccharide deacetylase family protein [candidate division Zixibacteria bacterium]|nr:polysaccharide deacetylase family protein [candidate division Zixibacteria bacterium]